MRSRSRRTSNISSNIAGNQPGRLWVDKVQAGLLTAEKLDEIIASVITMENMGHVPMPGPWFLERVSDKISQIEVMKD